MSGRLPRSQVAADAGVVAGAGSHGRTHDETAADESRRSRFAQADEYGWVPETRLRRAHDNVEVTPFKEAEPPQSYANPL